MASEHPYNLRIIPPEAEATVWLACIPDFMAIGVDAAHAITELRGVIREQHHISDVTFRPDGFRERMALFEERRRSRRIQNIEMAIGREL